MNEIEYERSQEVAARGAVALECLKAIIAQHTMGDGLTSLARSAYKYTSCGAALSVVLHSGQHVYSNDLHEVALGDVAALSLSSIVEGVEQTTDTHTVDLFSEDFETPEHAAQAYDAAIEAVEAEAQEIWDATHGCPTCAKHFGGMSVNGIEECEGDDGITPVWDECPDCEGHGSVI